MITARDNKQRLTSLFLIAVSLSLFLSLWINIRETVINPDGICYLVSAEEISADGILGILHLCPQSQWPLYSALIYALVRLTHLSYPIAAYVINGLFSLLSVATFISIVKELGGTKRILWLAAAVILLAHEFNSARQYIIRDHGFWACYLMSAWLLIRYFKQPNFYLACAFSISLLAATLFRIEGAIFWLSLPFLAWLTPANSFTQRMRHFLSLNTLLFCMVACFSVWLLLHPQPQSYKLGRFAELTNQFQHGFMLMQERYLTMKTAIAQHILTSDSASDAGMVLIVLFIGWYLASVASNLSWAYSALVIYAWFKRRETDTKSQTAFLVLSAYVLINVIITFAFLIERTFLSNRYLIALSLILMLWVPFALDDLIAKWALDWRYRFATFLAAFFIMISALGGIFDFGYSKAYLHHAGDWLAQNVPTNAKLYVNDFQLMYYSHHFGYDLFKKLNQYVHLGTTANQQWKQYDYIALRLSNHNDASLSAFVNEMQLQPIQVFSNKRGDRVAIYKVS